ncbi:MAG: hypothetical protein HC802_16015 [Caldilineaceae bacterium]|nr:hypothetical protein [Caldilineaceae bacterium]
MSMPKRIAAIITTWFPNSHADVIVTKFLKGFPTDQGLIPPRTEIVSMYVDQFDERDRSRQLAADHGVPIYPSIRKALTLGGETLAVDGVLLIGEHGDYAWNEKEQHLYPRKYFLEQICGVMATSGRAAPVFSDKHLSYNWADATWMVARMEQLGAPLMAGSSLPLAWRNPWLEHPPETPIQEALAIGYSGLDIYGFHTLEVLQCMVERRAGGESGVAAVTCLEGDAVWAAADEGLWSRDLADAAAATIEDRPAGRMEDHCANPALFRIEYRDGLIGSVLMLNGYVEGLSYAARIDDQIVATEFHLQDGVNHAHFSYLSLNAEEMFVTGAPTYPVARTLLTSGVLEAALDSRYRGHIRLETPHLGVAYSSYDELKWRPMGTRPTGASLRPLEAPTKSGADQ